MAREPPTCCGCVPRRPGLLAWAYIKLVLALTSIGLYLYYYRSFLKFYRYNVVSIFVLQQIAPLPASLVYLLFTIIFIVGVHRENSKLLLAFLVYSIFEVIIAVVVVVWQLFYFVDEMSYYRRNFENYNDILRSYLDDPMLYLRLIGPVVANIMLPIYFIVLIKRELKRLKISRGGARVVLDQPTAIEQEKRYNLSYIH